MTTQNNIPALRFPEFEGEYKYNFLSEICNEISYGLTIRPEYLETGIPLISAREISKGTIDFVNAPRISEKNFKQLSNKAKPVKGDLFLSKTGTIGFTAIVESDEEFAITQNIAFIRLKDSNLYSGHYFLHYFRTNSFLNSILKKVNQSTIMDLQLQDIRKLLIPIPTLPEQTRIATFLTAVDDKLNQLKKKKSLLEEYKKGVMQKLFSKELRFKDENGEEFEEWEEKKLGDIGKFFSGGTPLTTKREFFDGNIPFIRSGEINSNKTEQFISDLGLKNSSAKMVEIGDLIYALYGATSGEVAISKINGAINQAILCIRTNEVNRFLYYYLWLNKEVIIKTYLQGGQGNLSADIIKSISVPIPSIEEQTRITTFLTSLDDKISHCGGQIEKTEGWKKGLLQGMFV